jgi:hypothetical protein
MSDRSKNGGARRRISNLSKMINKENDFIHKAKDPK